MGREYEVFHLADRPHFEFRGHRFLKLSREAACDEQRIATQFMDHIEVLAELPRRAQHMAHDLKGRNSAPDCAYGFGPFR